MNVNVNVEAGVRVGVVVVVSSNLIAMQLRGIQPADAVA